MERKRETILDRGYIILMRKGNFYNWEIAQTKELAESYISHLQNVGYDCIVTSREVELNCLTNKK